MPYDGWEPCHDAGDVAAVRTAYPALQDGYAYLDGAAGTQVPGRRSSTPSPAPTGAASATSAARSRPATGPTRSWPGAGRRVADLVGGHPRRA